MWARSWQQSGRSIVDEQERRRMLNGPPVTNDPRLLEEIPCRVLRPFFVSGQRVEVGELVTLSRFDATSLAASGKVDLIGA